MAGTVTITEERLANVHKITFDWLSTAGGAADGTTTYPYTGNILKVVTVPDTGGTQPSDDYDLTLTDEDSIDVANGQLLNRDEANTEWVVSSLGAVVGDKLKINVTNAGNAKGGICIVYVGLADSAAVDVDVENALYGTTGITTWPAAAAPADSVSIAEGLRYVVETQIGTLTNTGGTATLGGILGDVAASSIATRLISLAQQTTRTVTAKSVSSITTANLFTISGGPVRILALAGYVTTGIEAAANETKIQFTPTGGAAANVCAIYDVTGIAERTWLNVPFYENIATLQAGVSADGWIPSQPKGYEGAAGTFFTGTLKMTCSATTTGAITWYVEYEPLAPGAAIVAA